ncbi:Cu(I)-responsive transcriptional regulator [Primorskyibacter sp. S187A]|uniref:Cu(I)-responsive transcriptional regulator n=1 Tax=Primorskyibacter sp. S187A TaxID=3415130 RepID=UPI003C7AAE27
MNIGEAAARSGLPAKTIRYYEDIGLVVPSRGANGYRAFVEHDIHKLAFLGRARALGFSVEDCRHLLALYEDQGRESAQVKQLAQAHLAEIDDKIVQLQSMRDTLAHLIEACHGDARPDCPILNDLADPARDERPS